MGGMGSTRWGGTPTRFQADGSFRLPSPPAWMVAEGEGLWRWPKFGFWVRAYFERDGRGGGVELWHPARGIVSQHAGLEATPANLGGGLRWWWLCPYCRRRSGKLYLAPRADHFACRVCHNLSYESAQSSGALYYQLFKSPARQLRPSGPQAAYLRRLIGPVTATHFREEIRAASGGFTVAPYEGEPQRPRIETQRYTTGE